MLGYYTEVVRSRDGRQILTRPTREHPDFMRLLCTWIRSTRPFPTAFPFTSISLNSQYAAKAHRDGNNAGPSLTRSLGNFTGGMLKYWPNDDGQQAIDTLPANAAQILDTRSNFCLFDGRRCHALIRILIRIAFPPDHVIRSFDHSSITVHVSKAMRSVTLWESVSVLSSSPSVSTSPFLSISAYTCRITPMRRRCACSTECWRLHEVMSAAACNKVFGEPSVTRRKTKLSAGRFTR